MSKIEDLTSQDLCYRDAVYLLLRQFNDSELAEVKYPLRTEKLRPLEAEESDEHFWQRFREAQEDDSIPEEDVVAAAGFNIATFGLDNGL